MSAVSLVSAAGFYPPPAFEFGVGPLGTAQITIDGKLEVLRATFMSGAVEAMPL